MAYHGMKLLPLLTILLLLPGCARPETKGGPPADDPQSVTLLEQTATELKKDGNGNIIEVNFRGAQISDADLEKPSPVLGQMYATVVLVAHHLNVHALQIAER